MHTLPSKSSTTSDVATVVGSVAVVAAVAVRSTELGVAAVLIVAAVAACVDLRQRRIPDELVLLALVPAIAMIGVGSVSAADAAAGVAVFALPLFVLHLLSPGSMGFGDVKLAVPLGAALGAVDPALGLVALCVGSFVTAFTGLSLRRSALPFGPGLVVGAASVLVLSSRFSTDWLLPWR